MAAGRSPFNSNIRMPCKGPKAQSRSRMFSRTDRLWDACLRSGPRSHHLVWPLPPAKRYRENKRTVSHPTAASSSTPAAFANSADGAPFRLAELARSPRAPGCRYGSRSVAEIADRAQHLAPMAERDAEVFSNLGPSNCRERRYQYLLTLSLSGFDPSRTCRKCGRKAAMSRLLVGCRLH